MNQGIKEAFRVIVTNDAKELALDITSSVGSLRAYRGSTIATKKVLVHNKLAK